MVGNNVQAAVDTKHHLIVTHDVTNEGFDRTQLSPMSMKIKATLKTNKLDVVAGRGYFSSREILSCDEAGIAVTLPKPQTSNNKVRGLFVKKNFLYVTDEDVYICPNGECLTKRSKSVERGLLLYRYWTNSCQTCAIKDQCTTGKERRVTRWDHEQVLDDVQQRLDELPEKMASRRATVEHPFGTIKY